MLLKMNTTMAGPEYAAQAGDVWECPDADLARQLVDAGAAEEVAAVKAEMTSAFHGGLRPANRELDELTGDVAPNPIMSTAREAAEVDYPIDRRTADELAADAKLQASGPVAARDPAPPRSSNQMAREEADSKIAAAKAAGIDAKASVHDRNNAARRQQAAPKAEPARPPASAAPPDKPADKKP